MANNNFTILDDDSGKRIDVYLTSCYRGELSRSKIQTLIKKGSVTVSGKGISSHYILKKNDRITVVPDRQNTDILDDAENIPLDILYEDEEMIAINKQAGLVVHPGAGNKQHTLVNALKYHTKNNLSHYGGVSRAGIIHRLDKDTSGVMVVAKNDWIHARLSAQFKSRSISKKYSVIVKGNVQHDHGICDQQLGRGRIFRKKMVVRDGDGKEALTEYAVIERFQKATFLDVNIRTGRTHQIRVHMAYIDHAVLGDRLYGNASPLISRQAIHARSLTVYHPRLKRTMTFEAPMPHDMKYVLQVLKGSL
ncbi:MAG: RluA family pseudouridine synthase [Candidatus Omnitrophica bacterium]|nr:RluA family pseudouridine synthase [Candidatus Omnitrophota bacterium]